MELFLEIMKFLFYSLLIVGISKYILVIVLRKFAESMNLKARTVGNLAGISTSMPELLSASFSAATGLITTSIYNILSSNIINLIQYILAIAINKNGKLLRNKVLIIDLFMVMFTIFIPLGFVIFNKEVAWGMIPIFILLFLLFYYINSNTYKLYLNKYDNPIIKQIEEESKWIKGKKKLVIQYLFYLILTGIALFIVGNLLSVTLENLAIRFNIPQFFLGIALGFITSIPELITFFESQRYHKKYKDNFSGVVEATNNLFTSNIFNLFIIQSIVIIIYQFFVR